LRAGTWDQLSTEAVGTTRRPFLNSRISHAQGEALVSRATSADWSLVPGEKALASGDPLEDQQSIDQAARLYAHFADPKITGVSRGKIHKVLYVMRPAYFPIVDSRLAALYKDRAREWDKKFRANNLWSGYLAPAYWAAIRDDLERNVEVLTSVRHTVSSDYAEQFEQIMSKLTDVRLLDMLAWSIE
jgi:hypothetical protein